MVASSLPAPFFKPLFEIRWTVREDLVECGARTRRPLKKTLEFSILWLTVLISNFKAAPVYRRGHGNPPTEGCEKEPQAPEEDECAWGCRGGVQSLDQVKPFAVFGPPPVRFGPTNYSTERRAVRSSAALCGPELLVPCRAAVRPKLREAVCAAEYTA